MKRKKIILIGPVYPYRGGISHYTGLMYRELARQYDVEMLSYKMQYPGFLFHMKQKDYANNSFKIENTKYMLHTANPLSILKTAHYIRKQRADMVLIQWWHPYFAPCYWLLGKWMGRQNTVFVCHNIFPHERFPFDRLLAGAVLRQGKHFIVHAREEGRILEAVKKQAHYTVTPHPTYNTFRFEGLCKAQARERLHMSGEAKILLFFGFVREYKGLKYLLQAMPAILDKVGNAQLWVVGEFGEDKEDYLKLIEELGLQKKVKVVASYTPDREVEKYFAASDLVVLPYVSATQSGIVQIAYGFEKPVIVTRVGGLPDVVENRVTGYVIEPESPWELAQAAVDFFENKREASFTANIKKEAYRFSWERMGEVVGGFMDESRQTADNCCRTGLSDKPVFK